jgi:hypothetical protein
MTANFVDLPPDGRSKYPALLAEIREQSQGSNAGSWALLSEFDEPSVARDAANRLRGTNPLFEFTTRTSDNGEGALYARFVGEG